MKTNFYIGDISQKTDLNPKTIRFWEEIGLLPKPKRTIVNHGTGYRIYGEDDISRLKFLKRAKVLGLSLKEMRQLLEIAQVSCCQEVSPTLQKIVIQKSEEIDQKIKDLKHLKKTLTIFSENFKNQGEKLQTNCVEAECLSARR